MDLSGSTVAAFAATRKKPRFHALGERGYGNDWTRLIFCIDDNIIEVEFDGLVRLHRSDAESRFDPP